ncbi:MAG: hypothetical protein U9N33_12305 [Campylobacterota bacterium]|nr:hypothetical protein [Campylobacterota bacterium]
MTKQVSPLLKQDNRKQLIQEAMQAISDKQDEVIQQANKIIGDVSVFEKNVHQKFVSYGR